MALINLSSWSTDQRKMPANASWMVRSAAGDRVTNV